MQGYLFNSTSVEGSRVSKSFFADRCRLRSLKLRGIRLEGASQADFVALLVSPLSRISDRTYYSVVWVKRLMCWPDVTGVMGGFAVNMALALR